MIPALNKIGVHAAVYGNHDFGKILATLRPMMELFLKNRERLKVLFIFVYCLSLHHRYLTWS